MALPRTQSTVGFRFVGDTNFSKTVKINNANI